MKQIHTMLISTAAIALFSSAYAADAEVKSKMEHKKNGGYESTRTSEHTTAKGTTVSSEATVDVDVNSKGMVDKTIKVEKTTDPKGLMNAKKATSETNIRDKERGGYVQETIRKSTDANGTDWTYKTTTDVNVDERGNVTTKATTERTEDPKGLLNEKSSTSTTKTVNGVVVDAKKKSD